MVEKLTIKEVQRIANEEFGGFEIPILPAIKDIAWAFPVRGSISTGIVEGEKLNAQEVGAYGNTLLSYNYKKVLENCLEGILVENALDFTKGLDIPTHQGDPLKIYDGTHMNFEYAKRKDNGVNWPGRLSNLGPFSNLSQEVSNGYFWSNISEDLIDAVLDCEVKLKENGGAYASEENTRRYLRSVKSALERGSSFLDIIVADESKRKTYPQMVPSQISELSNGDYFQFVVQGSNGLEIGEGTCINSDEKNIGYKVWQNALNDGEILQEVGDQKYISREKEIPCWKLELPSDK